MVGGVPLEIGVPRLSNLHAFETITYKILLRPLDPDCVVWSARHDICVLAARQKTPFHVLCSRKSTSTMLRFLCLKDRASIRASVHQLPS